MRIAAHLEQVQVAPKGAWLIFVYLLAIGVVLVITAAGSLSARNRRGYDARAGQVRGSERMASPQLRIGAVMAVVGAVGFGFWWAVVR